MALPSPTLAATTTDYIPAGTTRWTFVPTIANPAAPTSPELAAGIDYTNAITTPAGFMVTAASVSNASIASTFDTTIPGVQSSSQSSWQMKADKLGADARTALAVGTNGYVVRYPGGIVAGGKMDVWPVRVSASNLETVGRDALQTAMIQFEIPQPPQQNLTIPTA